MDNGNFRNELNIDLRDIFVTGINDERLLDKLFEENATKKESTFSETSKLALTKESVVKEGQEVSNFLMTTPKAEPVYFNRPQQQKLTENAFTWFEIQ